MNCCGNSVPNLSSIKEHDSLLHHLNNADKQLVVINLTKKAKSRIHNFGFSKIKQSLYESIYGTFCLAFLTVAIDAHCASYRTGSVQRPQQEVGCEMRATTSSGGANGIHATANQQLLTTTFGFIVTHENVT